MWMHKLSTMVGDSQDEDDFDDTRHGDFPISTTDLEANVQDYSYPSGLVDIKRMELKLDGTNWRKAEPIDVNQISKATDTTSISDTFNTDKPYYDPQYGSYFLYPIPTSNVTGGIKIWWSRAPKDFTSSDLSTGTAEPSFAKAFHPMLAYGPAYEIAQKDRLPNLREIENTLKDYEARFKRFYGRRSKDRIYQLGSSYINYE
jgi:hypothetical protein